MSFRHLVLLITLIMGMAGCSDDDDSLSSGSSKADPNARVAKVTITLGTKDILIGGTVGTVIPDERTVVRVLVQDSDNNPFEGKTVSFATTKGVLSSAGDRVARTTTARTDGEGYAELFLISDGSPDSATVTVDADGFQATETVTFSAPEGTSTPAPADPGGNTNTDPSDLLYTIGLTSSKQAVKSDSSDETTITAFVVDASSGAVSDVTVTFKAVVSGTDDPSGVLSSSIVDTDSDGEAEITFKAGFDQSNRTVLVTAAVRGGNRASIPVLVTGTTLSIEAASTALDTGNTPTPVDIKFSLRDAGDKSDL